MNFEVITQKQITSRTHWIDKISKLSGDFSVDAKKIEQAMGQEIKNNGKDSLLGHLRLCGAIPEKYGHDTSEEKLYSKYTDVVIHTTYQSMGFNSAIIKERADAADVECANDDYSFVADAKAFRLSRTAKNQKDFKVEAMASWKNNKDYAMVVCPSYQLPSRASQIYQQAGARSVCIGTYAHLAVFSRYAEIKNKEKAMELLHKVFKTIKTMSPSRDAITYWKIINEKILNFDISIKDIWREEKKASIEAIDFLKVEALGFLESEKDDILRLSKEEAIKKVLKSSKIENKARAIKSVVDKGLLG